MLTGLECAILRNERQDEKLVPLWVSWTSLDADQITANVDAVFIDICRQLLLRDERLRDAEDRDDGYDDRDGGLMKRKKRRPRRAPAQSRCVIL